MLQWGVIVESPRAWTTPPPTSSPTFTEVSGLPAGRRDLEAQDPHRTRCWSGGRRSLPDAPLVLAVLRRRRRHDADMTDRFELEVDTTAPSRSGTSRWPRTCSRSRRCGGTTAGDMTPTGKDTPDVDRLARSMLLLHGGHDSTTTPIRTGMPPTTDVTWSRHPDFAGDPRAGGRVHAATGGRPAALPDLGLASGGLPVLPRHGVGEETWSGIHCGAVEPRRTQRCARAPPRSAPRAVTAAGPRSCPEAVRQHQARGRRRLLRGVLQRPPRRRLTLRAEVA